MVRQIACDGGHMGDLTPILEWLGDGPAILAAGLITGLIFGASAQRSRFCLRAATVEFWRGQAGGRFAVWLFVFATALLLTQALLSTGSLDTTTIRQLSGMGSMSGAIIGGALFGTGMVLARGCASRLLVLSATGNLRALVTGLVLTITAQASLTGALSPLRTAIADLWLIGEPARNLATTLPTGTAWFLGLSLFIGAIALAMRAKVAAATIGFALATGAAIALGWALTAQIAAWSFEPVDVQSVTFTGPSANTLMALINQTHLPATFGSGLVPGVFAGAMAAAFWGGDWEVQTFDASSGMIRYMIGAALMGFGGMLAGGCAVGAGITGGSVMATTAWVALLSMWVAAGIADSLTDKNSGWATLPGQLRI